MAKSRFAGRYGRWRRRRLWRIRRITQMAERSARNLRRGLLLALAAELGFGGWQLLAVSGYEVKLVRLEEEYQIEWTVKKTEDSENPVYGIRLNPDRLELEFYHREPVEALFDRAKTKK